MTSLTTKPSLIGRVPGHAVPVYIGSGYLSRIGTIIRPARRGLALVLVTDRAVDRLYGSHAAAAFTRAGWVVRRIVLPGGERIKSLRTVTQLHRQWLAWRCDRTTPIVAMGGGTIGDVVGFAAATFLRGVPLWHVPTTILAQVDAAYGGKVGVNHPRGKNLIGCFYHPAGVIADPLLCRTVPARERRSGLAEVVKYGVIADLALFRECELHLAAWSADAASIDDRIVRRCARIKMRFVSRDEHDMGPRHALNFGHTLGHAFERWGEYRRLRHGEAVILGMAAAAHIAWRRDLFAKRDLAHLLRLCGILRPHLRAALPVRQITAYLRVDKKRAAERNVWVLPRRIGDVVFADDVSPAEVKSAIEFINHWLRRPLFE